MTIRWHCTRCPTRGEFTFGFHDPIRDGIAECAIDGDRLMIAMREAHDCRPEEKSWVLSYHHDSPESLVLTWGSTRATEPQP
jgi:hypothetical protein